MSTPPVKVGDELDVTIEAVGEKGDGLAKKNGFVLFVPGVKEGQQVRIRVTKVLRKVGFAEVIGQGEPAPEGAPAEEAPAEEAPAEEAPAEEAPAESAEDTESFGEEAPAEESSEESAEESDEQ
jgi:predicted RNA-binding protein with TRAM domain